MAGARGQSELASLFSRHRRLMMAMIGIILCFAALANAVALAYPMLLKSALDSLSVIPRRPLQPAAIAGIAAMLLGGFVVSAARDLLMVQAAAWFDRQVSAGVLKTYLFMPYEEISLRPAGDPVTTMRKVNDLKLGVLQLGTRAIFDAILLLGYTILLFYYHWSSGVLYLAMSAGTVLLVATVGRRTYQAVDHGYHQQALADSRLLEAVRYPEATRALGLGDWLFRRWQREHQASVNSFRSADWMGSTCNLLFELVHRAMPLAVLVWLLGRVEAGMITLGTAMACSTIMTVGLDPFQNIVGFGHQFSKSLRAMRDLRELLAVPCEEGASSALLAGEKPLAVDLRGVCFTYPAASKPSLVDVSLAIAAGEMIGIVGESGAGKSTLLRVLMRFLEAQCGTIMYDGQTAAGLVATTLRAGIGFVSQTPEIFTGTILENIVLDRPLNWDRVYDCARRASVLSFVQEFALGFDTHLGTSGANLSVGQSQRLALARALYRNPRLLILDEPTSALDAITENEINLAIRDVRQSVTTIVVSHRLSTVVEVDRIVVMHQGRIVEIGTPKELLSRQSRYRELWVSMSLQRSAMRTN